MDDDLFKPPPVVHVGTESFLYDEHLGAYLIKQTENWYVGVAPMLVNHRIVLATEKDLGWGYTAGWCYDKNVLVFAAALAFDPETEQEPLGYKKRAYDGRVPNQGGTLYDALQIDEEGQRQMREQIEKSFADIEDSEVRIIR